MGDVLLYSRICSGYFFLIWYVAIVGVAYNGFFEILLKFRKRPILPVSDDKLEGVTVIRPIKGIDPELSSCLESSFCQSYPREKLQILFCVNSPTDPSILIIRRLIEKYPTVDAAILISKNYQQDLGISDDHFGPNPKVNNLAKGFIGAKYDILWIMDLNVWALSNVLRNSVKSLNENCNNGRHLNSNRAVKLVHHVPLALCAGSSAYESPVHSEDESDYSTVTQYGAKLDEMFLLTSHSKFYVSLNNVAIAPCVNGKSNIYRKSDLDASVKNICERNDSEFFNAVLVKLDAKHYSGLGVGHAIKFFARYIGEDNMIAISLWENVLGRPGMTGDVVIQPLGSDQSTHEIKDYMTRRVRWLRVRKYMVLMATLVEPTTESIICGIYGTYAILTLYFHQWFNIWFFLGHMIIWVITDWIQYNNLVKCAITGGDQYLPQWLRQFAREYRSMGLWSWLKVWLMREVLALPIWLIAMFGHEIDWRGRPFRIKKDLTAEEL